MIHLSKWIVLVEINILEMKIASKRNDETSFSILKVMSWNNISDVIIVAQRQGILCSTTNLLAQLKDSPDFILIWRCSESVGFPIGKGSIR